MRTAFKIFKRDLKRILVNPVAIVIAIGVAIIPSLYAWFNILANWDPYENTSTVPIAVVIEDEGADIGDMGYINAGDMIENQLKENDQLAWTFVDSEDEALDGVKAGTYYAAFVVPSDFTASLGDILDGDTNQAHITYYVNEKVNAISPKVTDTGATTLENQIANQFVETASQTIVEKVSALSGSMLDATNNAVATAAGDLTDVQNLLTGLTGDLDGAQGLISEARGTISSARSTLSQVSGSTTSLSDALGQSMDTLSTTRMQAQALGAQLSSALGTGVTSVTGISSQANYDIGQICGNIGWAQGQLDGAISQAGALGGSTLSTVRAQLVSVRDKVNTAIPDGTPGKADALASLDSAIAALDGVTGDLSGKLDGLQQTSDAIKAGNDAVRNLSDSVNDAVQSSAKTLNDLQGTLATTTMPALSNSLDAFADAGGQLQGLSRSLAPMLTQVDATLGQLDSMLAQSSDALSKTSAAVSSAADGVGTLAADTAALQSAETMKLLKDAMGLDAEQVGQFMGSPVEMVSQPIFPVENYGSGVTPFYTNLALWVGGIVLVAIYKLEVDDEGIGSFKPWQGFFGRWLLMNLIGQIQAIICCVGDILLGIQCLNPVAFVFAGMVESFVYVFVVYALSVAFKHIGKALAVLIVILQIPGGSGTYPIEMQPDFFKAIHPWLPFTYGINAMREAIAGFYGGYYGFNLAMVLVFLIPAVFIGVTARRHLLNINALFDRKLGETDLMISERTGLEGAHFRLSTIVKVILHSADYKQTFLERAAKFELMYPTLIKRGFAALIWFPLLMLVLVFVTPFKFALLIAWIMSLVVICTFLIVVEYFHSRVAEKTTLADMTREDLFALLDDELRQEFMAFAPIDKILLERKTDAPAAPIPHDADGPLSPAAAWHAVSLTDDAEVSEERSADNANAHDGSEKGGEA